MPFEHVSLGAYQGLFPSTLFTHLDLTFPGDTKACSLVVVLSGGP